MDFYRPGRWDTTIDLVFMDVIRQTGPSPGGWDGTAGYARFNAPADGAYLVVGNFSGLDITMHMYGPWGEATGHSATPSSTALALALWSGSAGQSLFFGFTMTGPIIGYLSALQVYRVG